MQEWPTFDPQSRDDFSIGAEQSLSTVGGLAWSPPGLAKHRRCALAILTSSLRLCLYEASGPQGRWVRVTIVNHHLESYFSGIGHKSGSVLKKSNIRSFAWCPPVKVPHAERSSIGVDSLRTLPNSESRRGLQLLTVTNDDNDVILLEIRRNLDSYSMKVLSVTPLHNEEDCLAMGQPYSVFASTIRSRAKITYISCGPWIQQSGPSTDATGTVHSASATLAAIYGIRLKLVNVKVSVIRGAQSCYGLEATSEEHPISSSTRFDKCHFTGPLQWANNVSTDTDPGKVVTHNIQDETSTISLSAGIFAGLVTIVMDNAAYRGENSTEDRVELRKHHFHENTDNEAQEDETEHWEPIYGGFSTPKTPLTPANHSSDDRGIG